MDQNERAALNNAILRLNARAWGWAFGTVAGLGLLIATLFLVVKGGPNVGRHLELLAIFLPGYRVTWWGALIGFVYAFVIGYGVGRLVGWTYNRMVGPGAPAAEGRG